MINARQISRKNALKEIKKIPLDKKIAEQDRQYVIKKFNLNDNEFEEILRSAPKTFQDFKNNYRAVQAARTFVNLLRKLQLYPK